MPLSIKNPEVEELVEEVASLTGESKTEAVRRALRERRDRLVLQQAGDNRAGRIRRVLEQEIWPAIPDDVVGTTISREEEERILGYGADGT
ncbi:MAG: type II toxin-antitoxin system VapB family antitoxin [Acidobacteriota bacterium]|nr:type II toxin-antitoxin system VapB family antitoxin [Acidobacteriota bacterium]